MITKVASEDPNKPGRFIVDGKEISLAELEALMALFPKSKWIVMKFENPIDYKYPNNESNL